MSLWNGFQLVPLGRRHLVVLVEDGLVFDMEHLHLVRLENPFLKLRPVIL